MPKIPIELHRTCQRAARRRGEARADSALVGQLSYRGFVCCNSEAQRTPLLEHAVEMLFLPYFQKTLLDFQGISVSVERRHCDFVHNCHNLKQPRTGVKQTVGQFIGIVSNKVPGIAREAYEGRICEVYSGIADEVCHKITKIGSQCSRLPHGEGQCALEVGDEPIDFRESRTLVLQMLLTGLVKSLVVEGYDQVEVVELQVGRECEVVRLYDIAAVALGRVEQTANFGYFWVPQSSQLARLAEQTARPSRKRTIEQYSLNVAAVLSCLAQRVLEVLLQFAHQTVAAGVEAAALRFGVEEF